MSYSLSVHIFVLAAPAAFVEKQAAALRDVFERHAITINLQVDPLPTDDDTVELLKDLELSQADGMLSAEQETLLQFRDDDARTISAFFVRSTIPPVMGWSSSTRRCIVVTTTASKWVLAHEIGHVLLGPNAHVSNPSRLMTEGAPTDKVFFRENEPPLLVWSELIKIEASGLLEKIN